MFLLCVTSRLRVRVQDYREGSRVCRRYSRGRNIDSSRWGPAFLRDDSGKIVAYASQDGHIWEGLPSDWKPGDNPAYKPTRAELRGES
jgi:hypothetical protein